MTVAPSIAVVVLATMAAQIASAMGIAIFPVMPRCFSRKGRVSLVGAEPQKIPLLTALCRGDCAKPPLWQQTLRDVPIEVGPAWRLRESERPAASLLLHPLAGPPLPEA